MARSNASGASRPSPTLVRGGSGTAPRLEADPGERGLRTPRGTPGRRTRWKPSPRRHLARPLAASAVGSRRVPATMSPTGGPSAPGPIRREQGARPATPAHRAPALWPRRFALRPGSRPLVTCTSSPSARHAAPQGRRMAPLPAVPRSAKARAVPTFTAASSQVRVTAPIAPPTANHREQAPRFTCRPNVRLQRRCAAPSAASRC
jgi:hypothetical protein